MRTTLSCYFLLLISCGAQTPPQVPDITPLDEVMDYLLSRDLSHLDDRSFLELSRRPDGYYLTQKSYTPDSDPLEAKLWLRHGSEFYEDIGLSPANQPDDNERSPTKRHYQYTRSMMVNRLFWNYDGATQDAILLLAQQESLSTQEQEYLARAYSDAIYERISVEQVLGNPEPAAAFDLRDGRQLSEEQLEEINALYEKSTALYRQLPADYELSVGNPATKATNEEVDAYLKLMQYHSREAALNWIRPDRYDPLLRFWARAMLESCPPDALLFTYGDNDTYPLLYLQEKEGLRTDVSVINVSLLNLPRYSQALASPATFPGGPLRFSSNNEQRESWAGKSLILDVDVMAESPADWLADLSKVIPYPELGQENSGLDPATLTDWPAAKFQLDSDPDHFIRLRQATYTLANVSVMDLIATNYGQRPICAAITINFDYFPYSDSWQQVGLVKELTSEPQQLKYNLRASLDWWQALSPGEYRFELVGNQATPYLMQAAVLILRIGQLPQSEDDRAESAQMLQTFCDQLSPQELFNDYGYYHLLLLMEDYGFPTSYTRERAAVLVEALEEQQAEIEEDEKRYYTHQLSLARELLTRLGG